MPNRAGSGVRGVRPWLVGLAAVLLCASAAGCSSAGAPNQEPATAGPAIPVSIVAPEQLASRHCRELAQYDFPGGTMPPDRRGPEGYETMLRRDQERIWKRWEQQRATAGRTPEPATEPNAVLYLGVPTFEEFADDGQWHGRGILLHCGPYPSQSGSGPAGSQSEPSPDFFVPLDPEMPGDAPEPSDSFGLLAYLDAPQRRVSAALWEVAVDADEMLVDERAYYVSSGSVVRLTLDTVFQEGGHLGFVADARIQLRLPNTQAKFDFLFGNEQDEMLHGMDAPTAASPGAAVTERNYFAGLQASIGLAEWRMRPSIGIKLGSPLDGFGRLRFDRVYRAGEWLLRPSETFFWFYSTGWGETTNLVADYLLRRDLLFRSDSTARWTRERDLFELSQLFFLVQTLDDRSTLTYETGVLGETEPAVYAVQYLAAVVYRRLIHSDYLYLDLIPQTKFRKVNRFEAEHSFTLRLEMFFRG